MTPSPTGRRIMFLHAHPDDESSATGGTIARLISAGHHVTVVTCTDGGRGSVLNPAYTMPPGQSMASVRMSELKTALDLLGVTDHVYLGYDDSGWPGLDDPAPELPVGSLAGEPFEVVLDRVTRLVRSVRPDVLITYDDGEGYPHPDHIRCHQLGVAVFDAASDPRRYPGYPWAISKLYFIDERSPRRADALARALDEKPLCTIPGCCPPTSRERATTQVDVSDHLDAKVAAVHAHESQIDPSREWFALPAAVLREAWPYESYILARSRLPAVIPERSLLDGLDLLADTRR